MSWIYIANDVKRDFLRMLDVYLSQHAVNKG